LVYYDRTQGSLWGSWREGQAWSEPFLVDGYGAQLEGGGDAGIGASLTVDEEGLWHVAYVDGTEEALRYAQIAPGASPTIVRERVDDGSVGADGPHTDGRHVVGDDASIAVASDGEVRIAYQDSTASELRFARRAGDTWDLRVIDDEGATGFWAEQELRDDVSQVVTFWRDPPQGTHGVRLIQVD
jgi:hypothetical protein